MQERKLVLLLVDAWRTPSMSYHIVSCIVDLMVPKLRSNQNAFFSSPRPNLYS